MISYSHALECIAQAARGHRLGTESVPLEESVGRILTEDLYSTEAVPGFDNSAMDGFCVRSEWTRNATAENPICFKVIGLIAAGDSPLGMRDTIEKEDCARSSIEIMTGASMPGDPFDSVVRIEDVLVRKNAEGRAAEIVVSREIKKGENVRLKGTDYEVGQKLLSTGTEIEPHHVLACATLGVSKLPVRKRARVAVLSTGNELVPYASRELGHGMIRNSTEPYLATLLKKRGVEAHVFGIQRDEHSSYRNLLRKICEESYDAVISTGAVSMGKYDFISDVLKETGAKVHFHKVAIRPGKPFLFAELDPGRNPVAFFGMPGNPVSTAVAFKFFFEPYLNVVSGIDFEKPISARLALSIRKPGGLRCFFKGRAHIGADGIQVEVLKSQASNVVSTLLESNCWVSIPEDGDAVPEQALLDIHPFTGTFLGGRL